MGIVPVDAAPLPPAPRQPMRSIDNGVRLRRKPIKALNIDTNIKSAKGIPIAHHILVMAHCPSHLLFISAKVDM